MNAASDLPIDPQSELIIGPSNAAVDGYDGEDLKHLNDLEHVRERPGTNIYN